MWVGGEHQCKIAGQGFILEKVGRLLSTGGRRQVGKGVIQH